MDHQPAESSDLAVCWNDARLSNAIFDDVPVLSLGDAMRAMRLKLYDERSQRLMTFGQARNRRVPAAGV